MGYKAAVRSPSQTKPEVVAWIDGREQGELMHAVRDVIRASDARISECIKWSCPTFVFEGNIVSINPAAKSFVSLMFHSGGKIPADLPQLGGEGATCKYMRIDDLADLKQKSEALQEVVRAWCEWKQ